MIPWNERTVEYEQLRTYAQQFAHFTSIVSWLYAIGVVPNDVKTFPDQEVKTSLNPSSINCGYLASAAYHWDLDGESTPDEFLDAIEFELAGSEKKIIAAEALKELGNETEGRSGGADATIIDGEGRDAFRSMDGMDSIYGTA